MRWIRVRDERRHRRRGRSIPKGTLKYEDLARFYSFGLWNLRFEASPFPRSLNFHPTVNVVE